MPALSDVRFESLRAQLFTGATSDMMIEWLQANGATSSSVSDAWREMLVFKGMSPQRSDGWFDLLRSLGHTGSMNDMELQFWTAGGTIP